MTKNQISPYPLRLDPDLRKFLEESAGNNSRSLHAEIVARLEESAGIADTDEERIRRIVREELSNQK